MYINDNNVYAEARVACRTIMQSPHSDEVIEERKGGSE